MFRSIRRACTVMVAFLLLAMQLTACQQSILPHPQTSTKPCDQKRAPVITTQNRLQATSQWVYAANGPNIYALNSGNGTIHWCENVDPSAPESLSLNQEGLYVQANDAVVALKAASGSLLWRSSAQSYASDFYNYTNATRNVVYNAENDGIEAYNAQSGTALWKVSLQGDLIPPVMNNGVLCVGNLEGLIYGLDAATGKRLWKDQLSAFIDADPIAEQGILFVKANTDEQAINMQTGKLLWKTNHFHILNGDWDQFAAANGLFYMSNGDDKLYALDAQTGAVRWSITQFDTLKLLVNQGVLYVINRFFGDVYALNALNGHKLWQTHLKLVQGDQIDPQSGNINIPMTRSVLVGGELYVGTIGSKSQNFNLLHALNTRTGMEDWYAKFPANTFFDIEG